MNVANRSFVFSLLLNAFFLLSISHEVEVTTQIEVLSFTAEIARLVHDFLISALILRHSLLLFEGQDRLVFFALV